MILDLKNLPVDTKLLHQIITDLVEKVTSLEDQLVLLKAKRFGKSSEKLDKQIESLEHQIEESESLVALSGLILDEDENNEEREEGETGGGDADEETSPKTKRRPKRKKLPEHLECTDEISNPDPKCPTCDGESFRKISDDISVKWLHYTGQNV